MPSAVPNRPSRAGVAVGQHDVAVVDQRGAVAPYGAVDRDAEMRMLAAAASRGARAASASMSRASARERPEEIHRCRLEPRAGAAWPV
jgi:hypothetical protein